MDPEQLALLMALRGGQGFPATATPPFAASGGPGPMAAPVPQADPRSQWEAILFGPPPAPPEDPRFADMSRAGKAGLILSALGDVANVLQRRSTRGARTFAPSNYAGDYLEGQRQRGREKYQDTLRADAIKRQQAKDKLDRMTTLEDRGTARFFRTLDEAIERDREDTRNLRELQEAHNMPGASRVEILVADAKKQQEKEDEERADRKEQQRISARHLTLAEEAADREKDKATQEKPASVEARQIENEQRDLLRKAMGTIGRAKRALTTGESFTEVGTPAEMTPKDLRRAMLQLANRMGLDRARTTAFMRQVDLELFKDRGISPERAGARFDLFIPPKGMETQYMSPDGSEFSPEPQPGWINTQTGEKVGR